MEMGKPKARTYQYDGNGNPLYYEESKSFRSMVWDEENRLRGINDNGKLHLYTYDHTGERALKSSGESSTVVTNGLTSAVITHMDDYTAYVNPYFVVQKGRFTKHYFEGSSRIVSKLGEGTFVHKNRGIMAGGIDYIRQSAQMQEARDRYIKGSLTPPGPPTQHGIYASPEWTGQPYPSLGWQNIRQDQEPPEGWPRPPKFNEPGDVPGPPVQYGDPITPQTVKAGYGFIDNGIIEKNLYFYHPDHLGSSSYITDREGRITQHTEYIAFGEVLFEEHSTSKTMPYLFNGKELDQDTNLTYYGARYLDMKTSLWLNVDPLVEKTMQPYAYANNNPVRFIDPTGEFPILINGKVSNDSERASLTYWSSNILNTISDKTGYNINQFMYVDGDKSIWAYYRANLGRDFAKTQALAIYNRLKESVKDGKITEQLQVFTHSRGSAYGQGYMEGLRKEIISLAKADGLYFSYGADNLIEYSVNLAPHQSNSLFYEKSGTTNINISHYGDLLSGNDAKGNVINIHSQPPSRMKDQHGNATHNKELNMVLEVLKKGKNDIFNRIKNAYKHYDNTNQCNGCRESTVKGSN